MYLCGLLVMCCVMMYGMCIVSVLCYVCVFVCVFVGVCSVCGILRDAVWLQLLVGCGCVRICDAFNVFVEVLVIYRVMPQGVFACVFVLFVFVCFYMFVFSFVMYCVMLYCLCCARLSLCVWWLTGCVCLFVMCCVMLGGLCLCVECVCVFICACVVCDLSCDGVWFAFVCVLCLCVSLNMCLCLVNVCVWVVCDCCAMLYGVLLVLCSLFLRVYFCSAVSVCFVCFTV